MADIKDGTSDYPTSKDTVTLVVDDVDTYSANTYNGPAQAIVAIENELGLGLKGILADLATRLNVNISSSGGLRYGSSFPVAPDNTPHWFWRSDVSKLYVYDIAQAQYAEIATSISIADYVSKTIGQTISAVHQFNPGSAEAPFTLGANAQNQRVQYLCSDKVWDGSAARAGDTANTANTVAVRDSNGNINAQKFNGYPTNTTATADSIPVSNPTGKLPNAWLTSYVRCSYITAYNVSPASLAEGSWQTRTINTEEQDSDGICTLVTNLISLPAGTYDVFVLAVSSCALGNGIGTDACYSKIRLYDTTNAALLALSPVTSGRSAVQNFNPTQDVVVWNNVLSTRITVESSNTIAVQEYTPIIPNGAVAQGRLFTTGTDDNVHLFIEFRRVF